MVIGRRSFLYALGATTGARFLPGCATRTTVDTTATPSTDGPGADAEPAPDPSVTGSMEIMNWWGQEAEAMAGTVTAFSKRYPNVNVINSAMMGGLEFATATYQRGAAGNPPDLVQCLGGKQMVRTAVAKDGKDPSTGVAEATTDIYQGDSLTTVIPKDILDLISFAGDYYAVPLSLARSNSLYYNRKVFEGAGISPPKTWDEFFAVCETLKAKKVIPVVFGNANGEESASALFMALLLGELGVPAFRRYLEGKGDPFDAGVGRAVATFAKVLKESNLNADLVLSLTGDSTAASSLNANSIKWTDGLDALYAGKGGMMVIGDWANGYMRRTSAAQAGVDFDVVAVPGTAGSFCANLDSFYLVKGAPNRSNGRLFFRYLASRAGQDLFNTLKGSISPRTDSTLTKYDIVSQSVARDYAAAAATSSIVASPGMLLPWDIFSDFSGVLQEQARQSMGGAANDAVAAAISGFFKDRYPALQAY